MTVPGTDHIARFCRSSSLDDGQPSGASFRLRKNLNEDYLSVNWLEKLGEDDRDAEIVQVTRVLESKLQIVSDDRIAVLNVDEVCSCVTNGTEGRCALSVASKGKAKDPSYAGVSGFEPDDMEVEELIASSVQASYLPAGKVD